MEGYAESIATGLIAGRNAALLAHGGEPETFPRESALGSLTHYITHADPQHFQPANITFDLLPALDEATKKQFKHDKKARHAEVCRRAANAMDEFLARDGGELAIRPAAGELANELEACGTPGSNRSVFGRAGTARIVSAYAAQLLIRSRAVCRVSGAVG